MSRRGHQERAAAAAGDAVAASAPLQSPPDRGFMRLELLRLAHRHDQDSDKIIERARAFEAYVFDDQPADKF